MYALILLACAIGHNGECVESEYYEDVFQSSYAQDNYADCMGQRAKRMPELLARRGAIAVYCHPVAINDLP